MSQNILYNKNATKKILEDNSVNLFITHPPHLGNDPKVYGGGELYQINLLKNNKRRYVNKLVKITKRMEKALIDGGHIFIVLPMKSPDLVYSYAQKVSKKTKLKSGPTIVWVWHQSFNNPEVDDDVYCSIIHFYKEKYYKDIEESKNYDCIWNVSLKSLTDLDVYEMYGHTKDAFPEEISNRLIKIFSKPGDVVADLMGGTGTVAMSSIKNNRNFIYNDLSQDQLRIANGRINDYLASKGIVA